MSMIGPVQSHCHEGSPVGKRSLGKVRKNHTLLLLYC